MKSKTLICICLTSLSLIITVAFPAKGENPFTAVGSTEGNSPSVQHSFEQNLLSSIYQIDDGSSEIATGLTAGGDIICLNEFEVLPGSEGITDISVSWGTPLMPDPSVNGLPYTVVVWSDPNADGVPDEARVLALGSGVIAATDTNTFITVSVGPVNPTSHFYVGFLINHTNFQFPVALDQTSPTLPNRSFVAGAQATPNGDIYELTDNDLTLGTIESYGLVGNWLIRATATGTVPLQLVMASSEMPQGVRTFPLYLPVTGTPAVECRSGLPGMPGHYLLAFSFSKAVTSVDSATLDCGNVESVSVDLTNPYRVLLMADLSACLETYVTATLNGIHSNSDMLASAAVTVGLLPGDVNGDGQVRRDDIAQIKADVPMRPAVNNATFREDISANGQIDRGDYKSARQHLGDTLPPR